MFNQFGRVEGEFLVSFWRYAVWVSCFVLGGWVVFRASFVIYQWTFWEHVWENFCKFAVGRPESARSVQIALMSGETGECLLDVGMVMLWCTRWHHSPSDREAVRRRASGVRIGEASVCSRIEMPRFVCILPRNVSYCLIKQYPTG